MSFAFNKLPSQIFMTKRWTSQEKEQLLSSSVSFTTVISSYCVSEHGHCETRRLTGTHLESWEEGEDANDIEFWDDLILVRKGIAELKVFLSVVRNAVSWWQKTLVHRSWKSRKQTWIVKNYVEVSQSDKFSEGLHSANYVSGDRVISSIQTYFSAGRAPDRSPQLLAELWVDVGERGEAGGRQVV